MTCRRCFRDLPLTDFHRSHRDANGRRPDCRECRKLPARSAFERFFSQTERTDTCWFWTGYLGAGGYGRFKQGGTMTLAHRVSYELLVGPIPEGLTLDHLCRVRHCVNPEHLEPVTQRENVLRGEGVAARFARRTHCKRGHPLEGENLIVERGGRMCRLCLRQDGRERMRRWRAQQGVAA